MEAFDPDKFLAEESGEAIDPGMPWGWISGGVLLAGVAVWLALRRWPWVAGAERMALSSLPWRRMALGAVSGLVVCLTASWWHWHAVVSNAAGTQYGYALGLDGGGWDAVKWDIPWAASMGCVFLGSVLAGLWERN